MCCQLFGQFVWFSLVGGLGRECVLLDASAFPFAGWGEVVDGRVESGGVVEGDPLGDFVGGAKSSGVGLLVVELNFEAGKEGFGYRVVVAGRDTSLGLVNEVILAECVEFLASVLSDLSE